MKGFIKCRRCNHIVSRPEGIEDCPVCGSKNLEKSSKIKLENYILKANHGEKHD